MTEMILEAQGRDGLYAIFSEDEGAGYLYVYRPETQEVLAQVRIYESRRTFFVHDGDIEVMWSDDYNKCGVAIWGKMRGIIDLANKREISLPLESRDSPAIADLEGLKMFDDSFGTFIRARQKYWKGTLKEHEPDARPLPEDQTPTETNFIRYAKGPDSWIAVFEDDGSTGYLYLYNSEEKAVIRHLHIYDRSGKVSVEPQDAQPRWSESGNKCGVAIWGKMRGIINLETKQEGRVWLQDRDTPGIGDPEWLNGF